jgi:hypothetical protein
LYRINFSAPVAFSESVIIDIFLIGLFSDVRFGLFKKSVSSKMLPDRLRALYILPILLPQRHLVFNIKYPA